MSLRDSEFVEALEGFKATSVLEKEPMLPHHLRMRVAIMQYVQFTFSYCYFMFTYLNVILASVPPPVV